MHVQNVTLDSAPLELNMLAADARARWHPWAGSFFVGAALGIQKFNAAVAITTPVTQGSQTYDVYSLAKVDLTSLYLTPHVGWFKVYDNGLILGIDVGIQVPVGVRKSFDTTTDASSLEQIDVTNVEDTPQYKQKRAEAEDAVDTLGKLPMPYFTLIRVGWMF